MEKNKLYLKYDFYIFFPGGYKNRVSDVEKDISDIYVVEKKDLSVVFIATLYTIELLKEMFNNGEPFVAEKGMIIIKNLEKETIYECVKQLFNEDSFNNIFLNIGDYKTTFSTKDLRYDLL